MCSNVGSIPKTEANNIWKTYHLHVERFYDFLHLNRELQEFLNNLEKKQAILYALSKLLDSEEDMEKFKVAIEEHLNEWKQVGDVPKKNSNIQNHFNTLLKKCYEKSGIKKSDVEKIMYANKLQLIEGDQNAINKELIVVQKKIDETKNELNQLENNLQFFSQGSEESPLVKKVHADIQKHQKSLEVLKQKKNQIKGI